MRRSGIIGEPVIFCFYPQRKEKFGGSVFALQYTELRESMGDIVAGMLPLDISDISDISGWLGGGKPGKRMRLAVVEFVEGEGSPEPSSVSSQRLLQEVERLKWRVSRIESSLRQDGNEYSKTASERVDMEEEIDKTVHRKSYGDLTRMLESDRENVLDVLCKKTEEGKIDLKTEEGKRIWKGVVKFYSDRYDEEEVDSVYSRLAECSRTRFQKGTNEFIYDALFAIHGGANADFRAGFWLADKYAKHSLNKRIEKLQRILQG